MTCAACGATRDAAARFCPQCGAAFDSAAAPPTVPATRSLIAALPAAAPTGPRHGPSFSSSDSADHGRFLPGTILQDRYRVTALLGRGGMGEVYRADDMRLGQTVALKFLPPDLARDPGRLARFHNETRLARQVSHPNVARVYDIGEVDGQVYMTMEYIDGEDLGSLLRRIGRLPKDKGIEIARQICAGLSAAHDRGVLHRDLKPSNVMIDGRGRARIADFGLAGVAGSAEAEGSRAGTPAYMAPEHADRGETSVKSDLYALGLVLYEMFSGRRAFSGDSLAEMARQHRDDPPTPPSRIVEEFDPTIERVILRCLEKDARDRPGSAMAIAASLPGGDPLAMALAAGETPSPEMVAAAGESGGLSPAAVWACLAAIVLGGALLLPLGARQSIIRIAAPMKAPDVLADRSRDLIRKFGWTDAPGGTASGVGYHRSYLEYLHDTGMEKTDPSLLSRSHPSLLFSWYRQSPRALRPVNPEGHVLLDDPPLSVPGMTSIQLTGSGELWRFFAVPPQKDESAESAAPPAPVDWSPFFAEAGLAPSDFEPAEPEWSPPGYADTRAAWTGHYADTPQWPVRVEAASYRGRAVAFQVVWPWSRALLMRPFEPGAGERAANVIIILLISLALIAGVVMARRNLRHGRGDRRGALRLAVVVLATSFVGTYLRATHRANAIEEWELVTLLLSYGLFLAGGTWVAYIALEPPVRKRWPDRIIAWTRLLAGKTRDPLVGREILIGVPLGVALALGESLVHALAVRLGLAGHDYYGGVDGFGGLRDCLAELVAALNLTIANSLLMLFVIVFLRAVLRRAIPAVALFFLIFAVVAGLGALDAHGPLAILAGAWTAAILTFALVRVGLLALVATAFIGQSLTGLPFTLDMNAWYAGAALLPVVVAAMVVVYAARAALAGRSLLDVRGLAD
ncbi:MAG TPA: serine/threonine-protein kinase [Candidatus Polarisedimenticolia bacterium]|nr:serine/threonine-protein kinase [Candidatus Polarisedimenticolia bacterium]